MISPSRCSLLGRHVFPGAALRDAQITPGLETMQCDLDFTNFQVKREIVREIRSQTRLNWRGQSFFFFAKGFKNSYLGSKFALFLEKSGVRDPKVREGAVQIFTHLLIFNY